jgi:hypothetical protein
MMPSLQLLALARVRGAAIARRFISPESLRLLGTSAVNAPVHRFDCHIPLGRLVSIRGEREDGMLKWLMRRGVRAFERQWDYDAAYVHEMIDADPRAAWTFQRATALGRYRKDVPTDALAAAGITAVRLEDCGPCTQLAVSMAERAGVDPNVLTAVLTETPAGMTPDVALAWRFTRATLDRDPAADEDREEIVRRWGPRAVLSLAFAIITARMYPTLKYAMGHGQACRRVMVGGAPVKVARTLTGIDAVTG